MSIYSKNFGFIEQKCCVENYRKVTKRKNLLVDNIIVIKNCSGDLFRANP